MVAMPLLGMACSNDVTGGGPQAGALTLRLTTPHADDGAMTFQVSGPAIDTATAINGSLRLFTRREGGSRMVGAVVGALLVKAFFPAAAARVTSLGTPQLAGQVGLFEGIGIEALLTFFLVSAVFGTAVSPQAPKVGGFGIGLAIFVCGLVGGALTGAAMNPARAFGPALVAWEWHGQAVYWIGPLLGATVAGALWKFVLLPRDATDIG